MTTPIEFVMWMAGVVDMTGNGPTPEQWEKIKDKMSEAYGYMAAQKLMEKAEDAVVRERRDLHEQQMKAQLYAAEAQMRQLQLHPDAVKKDPSAGNLALGGIVGIGREKRLDGGYSPSEYAKQLSSAHGPDKQSIMAKLMGKTA